MIEMLHFYQIQFQLYPQYLLDLHRIVQIVDSIADHLLILDEAISQVDEVDDDEVEEAGKNI